MKICHCISLNDAERCALRTTCNILDELGKDNMFSGEYENTTGIDVNHLGSMIGELIDFFEDFGN